MLVLTRRVGETIVIGKNAFIEIVAIDGPDRVRIGISAPRDTPVDRLEVHQRKEVENEQTE